MTEGKLTKSIFIQHQWYKKLNHGYHKGTIQLLNPQLKTSLVHLCALTLTFLKSHSDMLKKIIHHSTR